MMRYFRGVCFNCLCWTGEGIGAIARAIAHLNWWAVESDYFVLSDLLEATGFSLVALARRLCVAGADLIEDQLREQIEGEAGERNSGASQ